MILAWLIGAIQHLFGGTKKLTTLGWWKQAEIYIRHFPI